MEAILREGQAAARAQDKKIDDDVELIKEFLRAKIGTTWAQATQPSNANSLDVDLSSWGGGRNGGANARRRTPWGQMRDSMIDYRRYVRDVLGRYCPWHRWQ